MLDADQVDETTSVLLILQLRRPPQVTRTVFRVRTWIDFEMRSLDVVATMSTHGREGLLEIDCAGTASQGRTSSSWSGSLIVWRYAGREDFFGKWDGGCIKIIKY